MKQCAAGAICAHTHCQISMRPGAKRKLQGLNVMCCQACPAKFVPRRNRVYFEDTTYMCLNCINKDMVFWEKLYVKEVETRTAKSAGRVL